MKIVEISECVMLPRDLMYHWKCEDPKCSGGDILGELLVPWGKRYDPRVADLIRNRLCPNNHDLLIF